MPSWIYAAFFSLAFSSALTGHKYAAKKMGWPVGQIFADEKIPIYVSIGCMAVSAGAIFYGVFDGAVSWMVIPAGVAIYMFGGAVLMAVMGKNGGVISLVAAPACALAAQVLM